MDERKQGGTDPFYDYPRGTVFGLAYSAVPERNPPSFQPDKYAFGGIMADLYGWKAPLRTKTNV